MDASTPSFLAASLMATESSAWEQRWHPLREEWVLYTSHRGGRPWIGETTQAASDDIPAYDPTCALCPGNKRIKGENPPYTGAYVFTNDLPCFGMDSPEVEDENPLYRRKTARGTAEVVCYHPNHGKTFADLDPSQATEVVNLWTERYRVLGARPEVEHVLIFENKGSQVGTSNPHPHCQIYAGNMIYGLTAREEAAARRHWEQHKRLLGMDILEAEAASTRVVCENESFLACVPWFARYAYEVFILPKKQAASLLDFDAEECAHLGAIIREVAIRYDNLWQMAMPYVMVIRQAPTDGKDYHHFPFHLEFHPPLRKPNTLKYLAGPEVGGGSMTNESNPEEKAAELRALPATLYRQAQA